MNKPSRDRGRKDRKEDDVPPFNDVDHTFPVCEIKPKEKAAGDGAGDKVTDSEL